MSGHDKSGDGRRRRRRTRCAGPEHVYADSGDQTNTETEGEHQSCRGRRGRAERVLDVPTRVGGGRQTMPAILYQAAPQKSADSGRTVLPGKQVGSLDDEIITGQRSDKRVDRADVGQIDVTLDVERSTVRR